MNEAAGPYPGPDNGPTANPNPHAVPEMLRQGNGVGGGASLFTENMQLEQAVGAHVDRWGVMDIYGSALQFPGGDVGDTTNTHMSTDPQLITPLWSHRDPEPLTLDAFTMLLVIHRTPTPTGTSATGRTIAAIHTATTADVQLAMTDPAASSGNVLFVNTTDNSIVFVTIDAAEFDVPMVVAVTFQSGAFGFIRIYLNGREIQAFNGAVNASPSGISNLRFTLGGLLNAKDSNRWQGLDALACLFPTAFNMEEIQAWSNDPYGFLQKAPRFPPSPQFGVLHDLLVADPTQDILVNATPRDILVNSAAHGIVERDTHDLTVNMDAIDIIVPDPVHDVEVQ